MYKQQQIYNKTVKNPGLGKIMLLLNNAEFLNNLSSELLFNKEWREFNIVITS